jgi:hypothetical protein
MVSDKLANKLDHIFDRSAGALHHPVAQIVLKGGNFGLDKPPSDHYGVMVDFSVGE